MDKFLAWDCMLSLENPEKKYLKDLLSSMLDAMNGDLTHIFTHECNLIMKGQTRSRAGAIGGLRLIFDTSYAKEEKVKSIVDRLQKTEIKFSDNSGSFYSGTNIEVPLDLDTIERLSDQGMIILSVQFTNGYGESEASKINSIQQNQAKETKNWLNYPDLSKNKSYLSETLSETMSQPYWYLVKHPVTEHEKGNSGSCGGAYQLSYDLNGVIDALTDRSLGKWWNKAISDEDPRVDINCKERLSEDPHDPHNWYLHGKNMNEKIDAMLNVEKNQSGEDSILYDDIEYNSERMTKQSWPIASFTAVDGLATGFEELMVKEKIISPLVKREFFHNIGMFLYTRAPKYWRNGEARIWQINRIP